jgi:hypothetical protein
MGVFGNRDLRRVRVVLDRPMAVWALEQWAKTEVVHAVDAGVEPSTVFTKLGPIRSLVQDARAGTVDAMAVRAGLTVLVQRTGGWVSVGVWRLLHEFGPADWLLDEEVRSWFVEGLRTVSTTNGGKRFPYQPDRDEEAFLRERAGRDDPLWMFIPMRGQDLVARAVPEPGDEPPWTDLPVGEERQIAVMTPDPHSNIMLAVRRADTFVVVIDAPRGDDDPSRTRFDLLAADTLPELYRRVGQNLGTRSSVSWAHSELEPYFPYERPAGRP